MYGTGVAFYGVLFLHGRDGRIFFTPGKRLPPARMWLQERPHFMRLSRTGQYLACVEIAMEKRSAASYFFDSAH
jgi:hypothetical protein